MHCKISTVMSVSTELIKQSNQGNLISWILPIRRYECLFSFFAQVLFHILHMRIKLLLIIKQNLTVKSWDFLRFTSRPFSLKEIGFLQGILISLENLNFIKFQIVKRNLK